MGVTLDLRLIDHKRIVVDGLRITNEAIAKRDPEILRKYLATMPVEVDKDLVANSRARLEQLRKLKVPAQIIQIEERTLSGLSGEPYRVESIKSSTFDELRELLGTWCWRNHSVQIDKAWEELQWFLEPRDATTEPPYFPIPPRTGASNQSVFDKAIHGSQPYPLDLSGQPIIRTLGTKKEDCTGYSPPEVVAVIYEALRHVDSATWPELLEQRIRLYRKCLPELDEGMIGDIVENELEIARVFFPQLKAAYQRAAEKEFGISCEFSL
jgi:hypothetical protein